MLFEFFEVVLGIVEIFEFLVLRTDATIYTRHAFLAPSYRGFFSPFTYVLTDNILEHTLHP